MAITLKDLNIALEKQIEREKVQAATESISMSELRELLGKTSQSEEKQEKTLESIDDNQAAVLESATKQLKQGEETADSNEDIIDELKKLININQEMKESLLKGWTGKQSSEVFEKVSGQPEFKSISERLGDWKKKTFSVRGMAQSVLGVKSGGIIDTMLQRREHKKQAVEDYMTAKGVDRQTAESEYEKFQKLQSQKRSVSEDYRRLKETYGEEAADKTPIGRKYRAVGKAMSTLGIFGLSKKEDETSTRKNVDETAVAEQKQESDAMQSKAIEIDIQQAGIDAQQLEVQNQMLETLKNIYQKMDGLIEGDGSSGLGDIAAGAVGGSLLSKAGRFAKAGLKKAGGLVRSGLSLGRAGLAAVGTGTAATVAAGVGGALLAGYAGKKLREHVEEKEAVNRAQEQEEISSTPINVEELRQLPDEGKAIAPGTINKVDRARNLMEQRVEAGQSFTAEEASLAKQKLGVVVPSELIGKEVTAVDKTTATPAKGTRAEYDAAYAENLKKTGGNQRVAQKLTALQVGLAPGASPDTLPTTPPTVTPTRIEGGKEVEVRGGGVSQSLQVQPDVAKEIPAGANTVYGMSSANAEASTAMTKASNVNTNVTAPTTVNNNTVSSNKPDVRNQDSSFKRMLDARYVPV